MTITKSEAEALFVLAGIPVLNMKPLPDGYDYDPAQDMRYFDHPPTRVWWFIMSPCGWVEIGWRHRVISINWEDKQQMDVVGNLKRKLLLAVIASCF